jgi:lipopolysaccharide export LptBFGC system permease protein LptF
MRDLHTFLLAAALACFGFSYWGLNTVSGRAAFDEMAGMIPLAATPIGVLILLCAAVLWLKRRRHHHETPEAEKDHKGDT